MPPPVAPAKERRNYHKYSNTNPLQRWLINRFQRHIAELVAFSVGQEGALPYLLDAGCGEGYVLEYLRRKLPHIHFCGLDVDENALELARARPSWQDTSLHRGDILNLPFADGSFDIVICLEVLEHLESPWLVVDELARVCSRYLLVSVPHQPFFSAANFLRGKNWATWGDDPEHLQRWWGKRFVSLLGGRVAIERVVCSFPWIIVLARV